MRSTPSRTWTRRGVMAGAGLVALAFGAGVHRWRDSSGPDTATLADLARGTVIDRWTVVAVHDVTLGAIPVVLATAKGEHFQVDVMARDPDGPRGVAETEHLSLYVQNRGDGRTATEEEQGLGAMSLAAVLRAREADGARTPALLTLNERHRRHPDGAFGVPLT